MVRGVIVLLALAATASSPGPARAGDAPRCTAAAGDAIRPLPRSLVPQAMRLFALHDMPARQVQRNTVVRCMDGQLLACSQGANLPCGKANVSRTLPAAEAWCRHNPQAERIPAYVSGHDSVFAWRCRDGAPLADGPAEPVDARGFISRYWKPIP